MSETSFRRLYRSRSNRVIGGVCDGLGVYLDIDPIILRVIWIASVFVGGTGFIAYLIAWILIPEAPSGEEPPQKVNRETNRNAMRIIGVALIIIACLLLALQFHLFNFVPWGWIWPLALVALGVALLLRSKVQKEMQHLEQNTGSPETESAEGDSKEETTGNGSEPPVDDSSPEDKTGFKTKYSSMRSESESEPEFEYTGETSRLSRSRTDRVIFGVCGGLAKRYVVDSVLIRVIWAVATVFSAGFFVIAYLIMAILLPQEN